MTPARPASAAVLLTVCTLALTGCGSAPLSPVQLRHRATAICTRANRRLRSITAPQSQAGARAFLRKGATALAGELAQLRSLSASGDAGHVYHAALTAVGAELAALNDTVHGLGHGAQVVPALRALSARLTPLETQADDAWRALQISACVTR